VNVIRLVLVTFETHPGKFPFRQFGINRADAFAGAEPFGPDFSLPITATK
jgi:hypothetical protein